MSRNHFIHGKPSRVTLQQKEIDPKPAVAKGPTRLDADQVEVAVRGITAVDGHQLVNLRLMRRRVVRDVAGPWAAAIDFRARLLAGA